MKHPLTVYVCQRKQGPVCFVGSEIQANTHLHTCHGDSYPLYSVTPMTVGIAICAQGRAGHEYSKPVVDEDLLLGSWELEEDSKA